MPSLRFPLSSYSLTLTLTIASFFTPPPSLSLSLLPSRESDCRDQRSTRRDCPIDGALVSRRVFVCVCERAQLCRSAKGLAAGAGGGRRVQARRQERGSRIERRDESGELEQQLMPALDSLLRRRCSRAVLLLPLLKLLPLSLRSCSCSCCLAEKSAIH